LAAHPRKLKKRGCLKSRDTLFCLYFVNNYVFIYLYISYLSSKLQYENTQENKI